jgi:hypothetical protein
MTLYLGKKGQGYIQQTGYCQRCGWKYLRTELTEDDYIKGLLVCCYCHDPDQPQRYPAEPRAEGFPPLIPAPDQYPGPLAPTLSGDYATTNVIDLSWTNSFDDADLINEYFIYRQVNGGPAVLIASVPYEVDLEFPNNQVQPVATPTTYADDEVLPGNTYAYYVVSQAVDKRLSPNSNVLSIFTQPPPPTLSGQYNYSTNQVDLSWEMPSGWTASVQNFVISRSVNGGAFSVLTTQAGTQSSYIDTTATSFLNTYEYYIVAEFVGANSVPSNTVTAPVVVTQVFTANGNYSKPSSAQIVSAVAIGAGAGGSGARCADGNWWPGAGGGGYIAATYHASAIPSNVSVVVGSQGIGGISLPNTGSPILGTAGGNSVFSGFIQANGGGVTPDGVQGGLGGTTTLISSTGLIGSATQETGGEGGHSQNSGLATPNGSSTTNAGPGGGSGGRAQGGSNPGITGGNGGSCANGGTGGAGGAGGVTSGSPGSNGSAAALGKIVGGGGGGGGGGTNDFQSGGGNGGAGEGYGAGGATGGAGGVEFSPNSLSGNGGNGGPGVVVVTTYS